MKEFPEKFDLPEFSTMVRQIHAIGGRVFEEWHEFRTRSCRNLTSDFRDDLNYLWRLIRARPR